MRVSVDGEPRQLPDGTNLLELLEQLGEPLDGKHCLVEVNGRFVPPGNYRNHRLVEGDRVEIIYPAFGG